MDEKSTITRLGGLGILSRLFETKDKNRAIIII
jgi:hypothetical protein